MNCESCGESIAFLESQTSTGRAHWHIRCWNATERERQQYLDEMDNLEGFLLRPAPPESLPALPDELGPKPQGSEAIEDMATATTTANNQRPPRDVVDFPNNQPVTVALKYGQGKMISSQYGERVMFTLTDGSVMFLAPEVAGQIEALGINVRESFAITRRSNGEKGAPVTWDIARVAGEQPNGTFVLQAPDTGKPPTSAATPHVEIPRKPVGTALVDETNALVDAFATSLDRALRTYEGRVKPEEVKALLITAYIQRNKLSSVA